MTRVKYTQGSVLTGGLIWLVIAGTSPTTLLLGAHEADAAPCESLTALSLPDTEITLAQQVPAGSFTVCSGWGVPTIRALFEATYFAGLRLAGMPEE